MNLPVEKKVSAFLVAEDEKTSNNKSYKTKLTTKKKRSFCKKNKHRLLLQKEQEDVNMGVIYKSGINLVSFDNVGMYHAVQIFVEKMIFLVII